MAKMDAFFLRSAFHFCSDRTSVESGRCEIILGLFIFLTVSNAQLSVAILLLSMKVDKNTICLLRTQLRLLKDTDRELYSFGTEYSHIHVHINHHR